MPINSLIDNKLKKLTIISTLINIYFEKYLLFLILRQQALKKDIIYNIRDLYAFNII